MESHRFEADVRQILNLVTHSLYSDREIFLRELVSNASDALDRARFEGLQRDDLLPVDGEPGIRVTCDESAQTITVSDDGVGLTREEAIGHLGTIAESGTRGFAEQLSKKGESTEGLIGKFGVGFYSAFMVAEKVEVKSLSALPGAEPIHWTCDGGEEYVVEPGDKASRGTEVVLHIRDDAREFIDADRLRGIVHKYSDFVSWPVLVEHERANQEQALWRRAPQDISDDEYNAFYKHVSNDWKDPLLRAHVRVEGTLTYDAVLFVPERRPWELDRLDYKVGIRLYQKRVKVLDHADILVPRYLRFVAGVVDSPDVDLNMSREILQQTPVIATIRKQLTKKVLKRLKELSMGSPEQYGKFWGEFGHILKEGIHEDAGMGGGTGENKELITSLLRWKTTKSDGAIRSLAEVKNDLNTGQDTIWYHTSVDKERIASAPVLEGFRKRGWEVVLMDDPVDEWVVMNLREFDGVPLKSVSAGEAPAVEEQEADPIARAARDQAAPLVSWMSELLAGDVAEVRSSNRLTDSPSVLIDQEGAMGANLERILQAANQEVPKTKRVLEINPEHPLVKTLARLNSEGKTGLEPFARLLLDHAAIAEGRLDDPQGFAQRLQALMEKAAEGM